MNKNLQAFYRDLQTRFEDGWGKGAFEEIFLTPRDGCLPDGRFDDLLEDIRSVFWHTFDTLAVAVARAADVDYLDFEVLVHPDHMGPTRAVILYRGHTVLDFDRKPWNFWWRDKADLLAEFAEYLREAATRVQQVQQPDFKVLVHDRETALAALNAALDWLRQHEPEALQVATLRAMLRPGTTRIARRKR